MAEKNQAIPRTHESEALLLTTGGYLAGFLRISQGNDCVVFDRRQLAVLKAFIAREFSDVLAR